MKNKITRVKTKILFTNKTIQSMIYHIRNQKVMLDFELAEIYGYETKRFNEQIKNNIDRFDKDFKFKLTKNEWNKILRSKKSTASWGGRRTTPIAFTETGIYMLMTILKGDLAIKQSKMLIKTFKEMKDYIIDNREILYNANKTIKLTNVINDHAKRLNKVEEQLDVVLDNFIDNNSFKHYLILDGQKIEADIAYQQIYSLAKKSIFIIDDYIDIKTLQLLKICKPKIEIVIFTDNKARNNLTASYVNDFMHDTNNTVALKENMHKFHDRYIIIDFNSVNEIIYHCGTSSKDAGNKITTIVKIDDKNAYRQLIKNILNNDELLLSN